MKIQHFFVMCGLVFLVSINANAASKEEIDSDVKEVLKDFGYLNAGNKELLDKANGILVFPSVVKAGFVVGGEYGEGSLQMDGKTVSYYSIASASVGLQLGAQERAEIILFMDKNALDKFVASDGWSAGVDGSIAVVDAGTGKGLSTETIKDPIIAIIMRNRGLMANLSFEGAKISKINR